MARRKKLNLTLEEQIEQLDDEIAVCSENMKSLKAKKKALEEKFSQEKKDELYKAVLKSGKSVEDVVALLSKDSE